ncbi:E3 ubiquitin-protein ligase MBR1 [Lathyrus oleraceus]|uniref:RING-type E3 ubiquitin transferase n=1 Tax=Pisum sativum TaxID=3888 RepID=A0A9D4X414_PEA|nr:E3 ubiquitin-protein ligase MBR1-like [Pisum sativum]KAI5411781.1 hypothetical protein KIW84_056737 [Pisum sativum]
MDDENGSRKRIRGNHQPSNPLGSSSDSPPNEEHADEITERDTSSFPTQPQGNNNGIQVPLPSRRQLRRLDILCVSSNPPHSAMITPQTSSQILHSEGVMPETSLSHQTGVALTEERENLEDQDRITRMNINDMTFEENALMHEMENLIDQHRQFLSLIDEMSNEDFSLFNEVENQNDEHQDMRLNIDDMSYEELLQLGERIGSVSTGLSKETIAIQLKTKLFSPSPVAINLEELPPEEDGENNSCLICQEEFKDQEKIGVIKCKHEYHANCITQWLLLKNSCPICKLEALDDA